MSISSIAMVRLPGGSHQNIKVYSADQNPIKKDLNALIMPNLDSKFVLGTWNGSSELWIWDRYEGEYDLEQIKFLNPESNFRKLNSSGTSQLEYEIQIQRAIESIQNGEFKKVVLAREKIVPGFWKWGELVEIFRKLCNKYPQAFVYLCSSTQWGTWMGASPEILLHHQNEEVEVMSLAGTLFNQEEHWTEKERAEQSVTSYFIENCLNWNEHDQVNVKELQQGNLRHLLSIYRKPWPKELLPDLIQRLSPTPAVCGYPRINSLEFILENEKISRELYAGFMGIHEKEEVHLNVNLRCAEFGTNGVRLIAGGGINEMSDWKREWEESGLKMQVIEANLF